MTLYHASTILCGLAMPIIHFHDFSSSPPHLEQWYRGHVLASAQNFARELMESPANHMTPTMFVEAVNGKIGEIRRTLANPQAIQSIPRYILVVNRNGY